MSDEELFLRLRLAYSCVSQHLRFGQFLVNVCGTRPLFYISDEELVQLAEEFVKGYVRE